MKTTTINGTELEYDVKGSGESVLLIGTGPIADSFSPLLLESTLTNRYRLISYRQRRLQKGSKSPVTFAEHAADAAALLAHLGTGRAHVAGHSTGAAIALQLAGDHPKLVHTLSLFEAPLFSVPSAGAFFEKAGPALAAYGSGDREGAVSKFLSMVCSLEWEACQAVIVKHVPDGVTRAIADADNFFESYLPSLQAWKFGPLQAAAIKQPILSVIGSDSEQLFVDGHEQLHSWFPKLQDCKIKDAGHLLHMQRPDPVSRGVANFLAGNPVN